MKKIIVNSKKSIKIKTRPLTAGVLGGLVAVIVLLGSAGHALAAPFENTYDWNASGTFQGCTYQEIGDNSSLFTYEWSQTINFNPAAAEVNWATLTLSYIKNSQTLNGEFWVLSDNNSIKIGNLVHAENKWEDQDFDISPLFTSFPSSSFTLAFKLTENTSGKDKIYLDKSVIHGDYKEVPSQPPTHTPVPSTTLLMGTGLAGLIAVRRRKVMGN